MREPKLLRTVDLSPDEIDVTGRLRPFSEAAVASLVASIEELGLVKDEVIVRQVKHQGGKLRLIAGLHRVEACRRLGRSVPAKVFDCTDSWAQLMEVDDNLAGGELTVLDTAVFLAKRKQVYEKLHPEAKAATGADLVARRWNTADIVSVVSFAASSAEKLGASERHVRRLIEIGTRLSRDEVRWLRKASNPVRLNDLQALAKIDDDHERSQVCIAISNGAKSAAAAISERLWKEAAPSSDADRRFTALLDAWDRAPLATKRRFLAERDGQISDLQADAEWPE